MTTALLVLDVQNGVVEQFGASANDVVSVLTDVIGTAREVGIFVVYARIAFRPNAPEVSSRNRSVSAAASAGGLYIEDAGSRIHDAISPQVGDAVVIKKRSSAFAGSDLEILLRSAGVDSLVLTGIATGGVVLSTLRYATDLDYQITVLGDACADADPEVHRVLLEKLFPRQADVTTAREWIIGQKAPRPV